MSMSALLCVFCCVHVCLRMLMRLSVIPRHRCADDDASSTATAGSVPSGPAPPPLPPSASVKTGKATAASASSSGDKPAVGDNVRQRLRGASNSSTASFAHRRSLSSAGSERGALLTPSSFVSCAQSTSFLLLCRTMRLALAMFVAALCSVQALPARVTIHIHAACKRQSLLAHD